MRPSPRDAHGVVLLLLLTYTLGNDARPSLHRTKRINKANRIPSVIFMAPPHAGGSVPTRQTGFGDYTSRLTRIELRRGDSGAVQNVAEPLHGQALLRPANAFVRIASELRALVQDLQVTRSGALNDGEHKRSHDDGAERS